jgi:hypothetical protein
MFQVACPRIELSPVLPSTEQVHVDVVNELATATTHAAAPRPSRVRNTMTATTTSGSAASSAA